MADYGQKETDELLEELEKKISREYNAAVKDMEKKCDEYFRKFEEKDEKWRQEVKDGTKTEAEYETWRKGQMMTGYRWEAMKSQLAEDCHNANILARSMTNGYMPEAYAINHNYGTYYIEKNAKVDTSYTLYDRQTVERLIRDEPDLLQMPGQQMKQTFEDFDTYKSGGKVNLTDKQKKAFDKLIADGKDIRWQKGQIQSVTLQSILQGESIPHMAKRIADTMGEINHKASVRYARTAMTGAQNAGRIDSYKRANKIGIKTRQTWVATLDNRTRHSHALMDGETIDADGTFSNGLRFPGDPHGDPAEVWNCRCTTIPQISGFETDIRDPNVTIDTDIGEMTYDEWREYHASATEKEGAKKKQDTADLIGNTGKGYTESQVQELRKKLESADDDIRNLWLKNIESLESVAQPREVGKAYYSFNDERVHFTQDKSAKGDTIHAPDETHFHEYAHNIDAVNSNSYRGMYSENYKMADGRSFKDVIFDEWDRKFKVDDDRTIADSLFEYKTDEWKRSRQNPTDFVAKRIESWRKAEKISKTDTKYLSMIDFVSQNATTIQDRDYDAKKGVLKQFYLSHSELFIFSDEERRLHSFDNKKYDEWTEKIISAHSRLDISNISDMLESYAIKKGRSSYPLGAGHGKGYWTGDNVASEAFAEMMASEIANKGSLDLIKQELPESYSVFRQMVKEMLK